MFEQRTRCLQNISYHCQVPDNLIVCVFFTEHTKLVIVFLAGPERLGMISLHESRRLTLE